MVRSTMMAMVIDRAEEVDVHEEAALLEKLSEVLHVSSATARPSLRSRAAPILF